MNANPPGESSLSNGLSSLMAAAGHFYWTPSGFPEKWPEIWPSHSIALVFAHFALPRKHQSEQPGRKQKSGRVPEAASACQALYVFFGGVAAHWMSGDFSMHYGWIWYHPTAKKPAAVLPRKSSLFQTKGVPCKGQTQFGRSKMYWAAERTLPRQEITQLELEAWSEGQQKGHKAAKRSTQSGLDFWNLNTSKAWCRPVPKASTSQSRL